MQTPDEPTSMAVTGLDGIVHPFDGPPDKRAFNFGFYPAADGDAGEDEYPAQPAKPPVFLFLDLDALPDELNLEYGQYLAFIKYTEDHIADHHRVVDGGYLLGKPQFPPDFLELPLPSSRQLPGQPEHTECVYICQVILLGCDFLYVPLHGGYASGTIPLPYQRISYTTPC